MRLRLVRSLPLAIGLALLVPASACKKKSPAVVEAAPDAEAQESPVPAPDGILAEGVIKSADAMLGSFRDDERTRNEFLKLIINKLS